VSAEGRLASGRVGLCLRPFAAAAGPADFDLKVPSMGDSISEGTIVTWQKKAGDYVNVDDVIVVLETDKVRAGPRWHPPTSTTV
jgi:hypothetical protein